MTNVKVNALEANKLQNMEMNAIRGGKVDKLQRAVSVCGCMCAGDTNVNDSADTNHAAGR